MRTVRRPLALALGALTLAASGRGEETPRPRADFEVFGVALDRALSRVSRPVTGIWLPAGETGSRGFHLHGYGAVFVPPARLLPESSPQRRARQGEAARALEQAARRLEDAMKRVDSAELRRRMEASLTALRETQAELRRGTGAPGEPAPITSAPGENMNQEEELAVEMETLRTQAEVAQDAVERSVAAIERQLRAQLPALVSPSTLPTPPTPPTAPAPPDVPEPPLAPWTLWFEQEDGDGRSADRVIHDVSEAVTEVLESHGPGLRWLKPEETVVVAVDFVPRHRSMMGWPGPSARGRAERTLVVRVRKRELEARRDGKLPPEELRKRIEFVQY
jgi:hypothetical protein